jgi:hypothetical protein
MMIPLRILPLLALLASCGPHASPLENIPPAPLDGMATDTPVQATCKAESKTAPGVKATMEQLNPGNWANEQRVAHEQRLAALQAYRDCMRRNGAPLRGGVEAPRSL